MKRMLLIVASLFFASASVHAAQNSVAGKWTGEQQGRNGVQPVVLEIKADGGKLAGTMTTGTTPAVEIADGKLDAAKVSFVTTVNFGGNERKINWSGEVKGDELTLTREIAGGGGGGGGGGGAPPPMVLKRAK